MACATYRPPYSEIFGLPDSVDDGARKCAWYSLFELHVGDQYNVYPTWLEPLGDWQVDGFAKASDIVRNEVDGTPFSVTHRVSPILLLGSLSFIYINNDYCVISRPLSVVDRFEVSARTRSVTTSSTNSLESKTLVVSNPFKSLSSKSTENIASGNSVDGTMPESPARPNTGSSRLWFGEEQDMGKAAFSSVPHGLKGLRIRYNVEKDGALGLAWTDTKVLVRQGCKLRNLTDGLTYRSFSFELGEAHSLTPSCKSNRKASARSWRYSSSTTRHSWSWGLVLLPRYDVCNVETA